MFFFRESKKLHFARINFRERCLRKYFAGIQFRENRKKFVPAKISTLNPIRIHKKKNILFHLFSCNLFGFPVLLSRAESLPCIEPLKNHSIKLKLPQLSHTSEYKNRVLVSQNKQLSHDACELKIKKQEEFIFISIH